ncbi:MAG: hypothetical protein QOH29_573, partial [Actinomycetota bacterium]|nr:hypothetical protein [Actinomycetota bacterium]
MVEPVRLAESAACCERSPSCKWSWKSSVTQGSTKDPSRARAIST